ncbi:hypothetical protein JCM10212_005828 [Sporobolomyces blumeae]
MGSPAARCAVDSTPPVASASPGVPAPPARVGAASPSPTPAIASTRPTVRPAPPRQGQPASSRNFSASSAGGASSHLRAVPHGASHVHRAPPSRNGHRSTSNDSRGSVLSDSPDVPADLDRTQDAGWDSGIAADAALTDAQRHKLERWGDSYAPSEETIRNDYSTEYVQTGRRPQNFLRNTAVETRFSEYPKLASLLAEKHALTASRHHSIPPTYLNTESTDSQTSTADAVSDATDRVTPCPTSLALSTIHPARFDCILLSPPPCVTFDELASLPLASAAANPGFVWLWVGSGQLSTDGTTTDGVGLEKGRELLARWGYRRCEDIVWLKTNKADPERDLVDEPVSIFTPTIEHCLMGIRGTVRRSTDSWFVHCNVDTDVIVWEGDESDPDLKPPELQTLIENFCLGTRRLHLYGSPRSLRRGWLTVSSSPGMYDASSTVQRVENETQGDRWQDEVREWTKEGWNKAWFKAGDVKVPREDADEGADEGRDTKVGTLMPFVEELDKLRPKSPPPRNGLPSSGGLGRGRGAGLGVTRSGLVNHSISRAPPSFVNNGNAGPQAQVRNGAGRGRGRGSGTAYENGMGSMDPQRNQGSPPPLTIGGPPAFFAQGRTFQQHPLHESSSPHPSPQPGARLAQPISHPLPARPSFRSHGSSSSSVSSQEPYSASSSRRYAQHLSGQPPQQLQQLYPPFLGQSQHAFPVVGNPPYPSPTPGFAPQPLNQYGNPPFPPAFGPNPPHAGAPGFQAGFVPPRPQFHPPPPPGPMMQQQNGNSLSNQFANLSLSANGPFQPPFAPTQAFSNYSPSPGPSPSLAPNHLPHPLHHSTSSPYLHHSSSVSSLRSSLGGGGSGTFSRSSSFSYAASGDGFGAQTRPIVPSFGSYGIDGGGVVDGELEYPIGGPSRRPSEQGT